MPLDKYRAKRSAERTPEPFGKSGASRRLLYVVQKHAARALHYDFRLEWEGVLKSWAVPKGPSLDPAEKRLAVEVEDHPVEYADFEGVIPPGNYGAGEVIVWDQGRWTPLEDPEEGYRKGKLLFELAGYKLHGVWTLVRTKRGGSSSRARMHGADSGEGGHGERRGGQTGGGGGDAVSREWLLIKKPDGWARTGAEATPPPSSIFSGLTLEEIRSGSAVASALREELARSGAPRRRVKAADVKPMLAELRDAPFTKPGWIWELKYDGYRVIAGREDGRARILYRRGLDATSTYPEIERTLRALPFESVVLDGEIVVLDEDARPSFQRLQKRALLQRRPDIDRASVEQPATLYVFDLAAFEEFDLRPLPLVVRKSFLRRLLPRAGALRYADHVEEHGDDLFREVRGMGLEGIVGKKTDAPYRAGRSADWIKVRHERTGDFAVVGFTRPQGSRAGFGALHLAVQGGSGLVYAGRVGSGFTETDLDRMRKGFEGSERKTPPCSGAPSRDPGSVWVEPRLVSEVRYKEWTDDGLLRQPVFLRLRDDKPIDECVRDDAPPSAGESGRTPPALSGTRAATRRRNATRAGGPAPDSRSSGSGAPDGVDPPEPGPTPRAAADADAGAGASTDDPSPKQVAFTNLNKIFWPEEGYTKRDLIEFYRRISPWLLPYLKDRPLVLTRHPDGIAGKSFFQKDAPPFTPGWVRTERIWSEGAEREIDFIICDDIETLLFIANMGTIPLHLWASRAQTPQQPDWCILDLDPKGAPFTDVVKVAREIRRLTEEIELPAFLKTSGSTGLHVLVPLGGQCTHAESRAFGELLCRVVEGRLPDISTTARHLGSRGGRVYLDYLQNGLGKTIAGPFSVRPLPGATVSTPLDWNELTARLDPARFTIETVPRRMVKRKDDPLVPVLTLRPDLSRALSRLSELLVS